MVIQSKLWKVFRKIHLSPTGESFFVLLGTLPRIIGPSCTISVVNLYVFTKVIYITFILNAVLNVEMFYCLDGYHLWDLI